MSTDKITCLLNWEATVYHAAIFLAQKQGLFAREGVKVAILEPNDPSDVTEIIGSGKVDIGCKAMIHTIAGKARGFPIKAFGSLLDEPFTGVIYLHGSGITEDFRTLKGRRIGYVGEFGKIQIDELTKHYNMKPQDYTAVRCGMNISKALIEGTIDAGIGLENIQQVELEHWCQSNGRPITDVKMLRIDELAELGCCCFCTILFIGNENFIEQNPQKITAFMKAIKAANDYVLQDPVHAFQEYAEFKPLMNTLLNRKMFERSFVYFSKDLRCVPRDWDKVTQYAKRLGVIDDDFQPNYTNEFCSWEAEEDDIDPIQTQQQIAAIQRDIASHGGVFAGKVNRPIRAVA